MKRKAIYIVAGFFSLLLLLNCRKEKINNNPPVQGATGLKVKILEYGSGIPLANVRLTIKKCRESGKFGCIDYEEIKSWTSGADGIISIPVFKNTSDSEIDVSEAEHWPKSGFSIFDTVIQKLAYDSAVIRLYPTSTIQFHFKNINSYGAKEWLRSYIETVPDFGYPISFDPPFTNVQVANKFDSLIIFTSYGNVKNRLVCELLDSNFSYIRKVYDDNKFIPKSSTSLEWNVNY